MTVGGQFSCPPAGSFVAVSGQFLVAADTARGMLSETITRNVAVDSTPLLSILYRVEMDRPGAVAGSCHLRSEPRMHVRGNPVKASVLVRVRTPGGDCNLDIGQEDKGLTVDIPKIISVDDHVIEAPNVWQDRLPSKYAESGPRVERKRITGVRHLGGASYELDFSETEGQWGDVWFYEGKPTYAHKRNTIIPDAAVRTEEGIRTLNSAAMDLSPVIYDDMFKSCYDAQERVKIMLENWVDGSLCFPTFPRFCGQTFYEGEDKDLGMACVQAYNDWMVDDWCGGSEGHLIPLCLIPLWDVEAAALEIRRNAARGVHAVAFSEIPPRLGLPSIHSGYWDPFFRACEETRTTVNMHIGSSSRMPQTSPDAGSGVSGSLVWVNSALSLMDFLFSGVLRRFPKLKIAYSEGGIGWIPFALEKADDFWEQHNAWTDLKSTVPEPPSTYYYTNVYGCTIRDPFGLQNLDRVGVDNVTFETDFPHTDGTWPHTKQTAESLLEGLPDEVKYKVLRGNAIEMLSLPKERVQAR